MSSDDEVDEFGRTRIRNRKRSRSPHHKRSKHSPRKYSRSPRRSPNYRRRETDRKERNRDRERERDRDRERDRERERYKEKDPTPKGPSFDSAVDNYVSTLKKMSKIESCQVEVDDDPALDAAMEDDCNLEEEQMSKLMGFSGFDSTKVRR